jgi:hypothetical protein
VQHQLLAPAQQQPQQLQPAVVQLLQELALWPAASPPLGTVSDLPVPSCAGLCELRAAVLAALSVLPGSWWLRVLLHGCELLLLPLCVLLVFISVHDDA